MPAIATDRFSKIRQAARRYEAAKVVFLREDAAYDAIFRDVHARHDAGEPFDHAALDKGNLTLSPAQVALETTHRRLCDMIGAAGYSAAIVAGQCYIGYQTDDINDCSTIEFAASKLLNLDVTEGGRS